MALPESGKFLARQGLTQLITLIKGALDDEKREREQEDATLSSRVTPLETFKNVTVPNTYATITNLNQTNQNVATNMTNISQLTGRVQTNEGEIDDIWEALEASVDPDNPQSVTAQVANILDSAPEDFNTFLKVYQEFAKEQDIIETIQDDVSEAITVKSYNASSTSPTTYIVKVQSGTGNLPGDMNTLTFCY